MKLSNKTHITCPKCGIEAHGLSDISDRFGYFIEDEEVQPYVTCKACRSPISFWKRQRKAPVSAETTWASAAAWARKIHISEEQFNEYLIDMRYMEFSFHPGKDRKQFVVTDKGSVHSAETHSTFGKKILWDYDTFRNVIKLRCSMAEVHPCCPRCKAYLDEDPEYEHLALTYTCSKCGYVSDTREMNVTFDI
ncbi:MAG: hypothetical protein E7299_11135 [Lachnospiraceae bacterium]|nr:hypothetical protein [Lachnospiraceae bacterium]